MPSIREQFRNNVVALISLVVALTSLGYNAWRNDITENNRNVRQAGFEVLKQLGELQLVVDYLHYEKDKNMGNPITGWGRVLLIRDLAQVMPAPAPDAATSLFEAWQSDWARLESDEKAVEHVTAEVKAARQAVLASLRMLR